MKLALVRCLVLEIVSCVMMWDRDFSVSRTLKSPSYSDARSSGVFLFSSFCGRLKLHGQPALINVCSSGSPPL